MPPASRRTASTTARGYGHRHQQQRLRILHRDHRTCQCCGARATHADHVVPLARGGTSDDTNMQALCGPCNVSKHDGPECRLHPRTARPVAHARRW